MKRGLKKIFKKEGYTKKQIYLAFSILIIALLIFSGYYLFYRVRSCESKDCFDSAMKSCERISWTREDDQAAWRYIILSNYGNSGCEVQIELLKMKKGAIDAEKLENKKMICLTLKQSQDYPEKDISTCTGPLKEEMQDVLIKRMHNYLLKNLGEISKEFDGL